METRIYDKSMLYAVEIRSQGRLVEVSAMKRTLQDQEAQFTVSLYHHPEAQVSPTAQVSFTETQIGPLLYLMTHGHNIDTLSGDGKRLTFEASTGQIAISDMWQNRPSAWVQAAEIAEILARTDVQAGIFRALRLKQPTLAL